MLVMAVPLLMRTLPAWPWPPPNPRNRRERGSHSGRPQGSLKAGGAARATIDHPEEPRVWRDVWPAAPRFLMNVL